MKDKNKLFKSELSKITGLKASTIKYYAEIGILPFQQESTGDNRVFDRAAAVKRIKEIIKLKEKRFTIDEIRERDRKSVV